MNMKRMMRLGMNLITIGRRMQLIRMAKIMKMTRIMNMVNMIKPLGAMDTKRM